LNAITVNVDTVLCVCIIWALIDTTDLSFAFTVNWGGYGMFDWWVRNGIH